MKAFTRVCKSGLREKDMLKLISQIETYINDKEFRAGIRLEQHAQDREPITLAYCELSQIHFLLGKRDLALESIGKAIHLFKELDC